jgi:hypothetical protein
MAEPLVILRNKSRFRMFKTTLYHKVVCVQGGKCICNTRTRNDGAHKGEKVLQERSIFLPPGQESDALPRAVLEVPQVHAAIADNWLENLAAKAAVEVLPAKR